MAFDYSSRDYSTIKADLLARASRVAPDWTDRNPSDFGMVMVDLWAHMGDVIHYYVDRAAGESVLPTATQRESVLAFANLLDYIPSGRTSAQGTVTLTNTGTADVSIPEYTRLIARYDDDTYQLYVTEDYTITAGNTVSVNVNEGYIVNAPAETLTTGSSGRSGQRYTLSNSGAVRDSIVITVYEDGVTPTIYRRVDRLSNAVVGDRVFSVRTSATGATQIVFGTEVRGFIPPAGALIEVVYAYSSGDDGNLPADSVYAFRDSTPVGVVITSSSAMVGGVDEETIASLKTSIPTFASSQRRAVTEFDFVSLTVGIDGISKAAVNYIPNPAGGASAGNASVVVYPQINRSSDYLTTTDTSQTVSADTQQTVVNTLQPRTMLGIDVVSATSIDWTPIHLNVTVNLADNVVALYAKRDVEDIIDALFAFNSVTFGQTMSLGTFYRFIHSVYGVNYAVIDRFDTGTGTSVQTSITVDDLSLPKKGTVVVTVIGGITST